MSRIRCLQSSLVSDVPLIYNHNHELPRLAWTARLIAGTLAAGALAVLVTAALLEPNARGVETHTQLGLPPCGLLRATGIPCMTCGMTTSFTHLAHGNLWQSLVVQPAGTLLALLTATGFWISAYIAATGRPSARLLHMVPWTRILFSVLGLVIVGWIYKIVVVLNA